MGSCAVPLPLRERLALKFMTFTRGEHGISLLDKNGEFNVPAMAREVFDVSGAGDTVIAVMAACVAVGEQACDVRDAVRLANLAGGVVVGKVGTVPIGRDELLDRLDHEPGLAHLGKVCDRAAAVDRCRAWRVAGERVVFASTRGTAARGPSRTLKFGTPQTDLSAGFRT